MKKNNAIIIGSILILILIAYALIVQNSHKTSTVQSDSTLLDTPPTSPADPASESDEYAIDPSDYIDPDTLLANEPLKSVATELSQREISDLLLMREEEKLARDVYQFLYAKWNTEIFTNIAASEQTHMDAMGALLERNGIPDPITSDEAGVFSDEAFSKLYTELTQKGETSLAAALTVGAQIEDLDIKDLQEAIEATTQNDIKTVYSNLVRGSRNHMRAFNRQLVRETGTDYQANYISQEQLDEILSGSQERGNNN